MQLQELGENRSGEPVVLIHGFAASAFSGRLRTGWARTLGRAPDGTATERLLVPGRGHVDVRTARSARQGAAAFLLRTTGRRAGGGLP